MPTPGPAPTAPFALPRPGPGGSPYGRFRSAAYRAPSRGIRIPSALPDDIRVACDAVALALPGCAAFWGPTAARLWGLPVPAYADRGGTVLHVAVPTEATATPRRTGVLGHRVRLSGGSVTVEDGRRLTTPARTLVDLGRTLWVPDLVAAGDVVLRRRLTFPEALTECVGERRGAPGTRVARRALPLLDPRSESPQESRLRAHLVLGGLPPPIPNHVIRDVHGGFVARGDLCYPELRIVIEYDGSHHDDPRRRRADATRRTLLREHGWYVVEVHADDLRHPERALAKVRAALRARGAGW